MIKLYVIVCWNYIIIGIKIENGVENDEMRISLFAFVKCILRNKKKKKWLSLMLSLIFSLK